LLFRLSISSGSVANYQYYQNQHMQSLKEKPH